jgi:hypothetical protein
VTINVDEKTPDFLDLRGKEVNVFYNDFSGVNKRHGVITNYSENEIELENYVIIPRKRIVRIEVVGAAR